MVERAPFLNAAYSTSTAKLAEGRTLLRELAHNVAAETVLTGLAVA